MPGPKEHAKVEVWIHSRGDQGRYVLLLRTTPSRGAFWQPVTGSVDPGETLDRAALREAQEESGLAFTHSPRPVGFEFTFTGHFGLARETVFELEAAEGGPKLRPGMKLDPHEHDDAKWVRPEEALQMLKFESNAQALRLLMNKWKKG